MSSYRRLYVPGGTYFFTVTLANRSAQHLTEEIALLRQCYAAVQRDMPFRTDAIVVLPDHIHAVWTLPDGDSDFSRRWHAIKATFSRHCRATGQERPSLLRKGEKGIWQRRFWEHAIRNQADFDSHIRYVIENPVKHGLVARPEDWVFSSIHRQATAGNGGILPPYEIVTRVAHA
jgi:putative transposase